MTAFRFSVAQIKRPIAFAVCGFFAAIFPINEAHSLELAPAAYGNFNGFGSAASLDNNQAVIGAYGMNDNAGAAYLFRNLSGATTSPVTENVILTASNGNAQHRFGSGVSLSGNQAVVSAPYYRPIDDSFDGIVYLFRGLDSAGPAVTETAMLKAASPLGGMIFGASLSLDGDIALVGASGTDGAPVYVFRNLSGIAGNATATEDARLTTTDRSFNDGLGGEWLAASVSGTNGLIGAFGAQVGAVEFLGSAYFYRDLDSVSGEVTQDVKLAASDSVVSGYFGHSVDLDGTQGLVGAPVNNTAASAASGAAYLFRDLDTAPADVTEDLKLVASDGESGDYFGDSVSVDGTQALVGAPYNTSDENFGAAYLFLDIDTAAGPTVTESVKILSFSPSDNPEFGVRVDLQGDRFLVGALIADSARYACTGSISSFTTLDTGSTSATISGFSFTSRLDWVIGENSDSNSVTAATLVFANVTESGRAIYIGKNAGSDNNSLIVSGRLTAREVYIGSIAGNTGNLLQINEAGQDHFAYQTDAVYLAPGNSLVFENVAANITSLLDVLVEAELYARSGGAWVKVTSANYTGLVSLTNSSGNLVVSQALGTVAAPSISPNGGSFAPSVDVTLATATSGASIYYTTNGSEPTTSSTLYSAPFTLAASGTLKAKAFRSGWNESPTTSATFTISADNVAPLLAIATPKANAKLGGTSATLNATFAGTIKQSNGTPTLEYQVGSSGWLPVTVTASSKAGIYNWTTSVALEPGTNSATFRATSPGGTQSMQLARSVIYAKPIANPSALIDNSGANGAIALPKGAINENFTYTLSAKPASGYIVGQWFKNGSPISNEAGSKLSITANEGDVYHATFVPNFFGAAQGAYPGIFGDGDTDGALLTTFNLENGGASFTLAPTGIFSGTVTIGRQRLTFQGQFDGLKKATVTTPALSLDLTLDTTTAVEKITGTAIYNGGSPIAISSFRAKPYTGKAGSIAPLNGKRYSLALQRTVADSSMGHGFASVAIGKTGVATLSGQLPDGTAFTLNVPVIEKAGGLYSLPVSRQLAKGNTGLLQGELVINGASGEIEAVSGLGWMRAIDAVYPSGILRNLSGLGSLWTVPPAGVNLLTGDGQLALFSFSIDKNNAFGIPNTPGLYYGFWPSNNKPGINALPAGTTFTFTASTGAFNGKVVKRVGAKNKSLLYQGLVLPLPVVGVNPDPLHGVGYSATGAVSSKIEVGETVLTP